MAVPIYTIRMFAERGVLGERLINVPTGKVWVVRNIDCYCNNSSPDWAQVYVGDFNRGLTFWWHHWDGLEQGVGNWEGRQAIPWEDGAGVLKVFVLEPQAIDVSITGYELTSPPVT